MRFAFIAAALMVAAGQALAQTSPGGPELQEFEGPFGRPTASFAADFTVVLNGVKSDGRYYFIPNRIRWEWANQVTSIVYLDLWVGYSLIPSRRLYVEVDHRNSSARSDGPNAPHWTVKREGEDTDQGLVRTRYHVEARRANGNTFTATMWLAEAYNLVVEIDGVAVIGGKTLTSHFKIGRIEIGPQDPALFYPPADYQRMGTGLDPMPGGKPQGAVSP